MEGQLGPELMISLQREFLVNDGVSLDFICWRTASSTGSDHWAAAIEELLGSLLIATMDTGLQESASAC